MSLRMRVILIEATGIHFSNVLRQAKRSVGYIE
jgi:hypothetical protein